MVNDFDPLSLTTQIASPSTPVFAQGPQPFQPAKTPAEVFGAPSLEAEQGDTVVPKTRQIHYADPQPLVSGISSFERYVSDPFNPWVGGDPIEKGVRPNPWDVGYKEAMAKEAVNPLASYMGEKVKAVNVLGRVMPRDVLASTTGGGELLYYMDRNASGKERGFLEALHDSSWTDFVPFFGAFAEIGGSIYEAKKANDTFEKILREEDVTNDELVSVAAYQARQEWRDSTTVMGTVADITKTMPALCVEFGVTSKALQAGVRGLTKVSPTVAKATALSGATKQSARSTIKGLKEALSQVGASGSKHTSTTIRNTIRELAPDLAAKIDDPKTSTEFLAALVGQDGKLTAKGIEEVVDAATKRTLQKEAAYLGNVALNGKESTKLAGMVYANKFDDAAKYLRELADSAPTDAAKKMFTEAADAIPETAKTGDAQSIYGMLRSTLAGAASEKASSESMQAAVRKYVTDQADVLIRLGQDGVGRQFVARTLNYMGRHALRGATEWGLDLRTVVGRTAGEELKHALGVALIEAPIKGAMMQTFGMAARAIPSVALTGDLVPVSPQEMSMRYQAMRQDDPELMDKAFWYALGMQAVELASENVGEAFGALGRAALKNPAARTVTDRLSSYVDPLKVSQDYLTKGEENGLAFRRFLSSWCGDDTIANIEKSTLLRDLAVKRALNDPNVVSKLYKGTDTLTLEMVKQDSALYKAFFNEGRKTLDGKTLRYMAIRDKIVKAASTGSGLGFTFNWLTPSGIRRMARQFGWNGTLEEWMEERYGGFMSGLLGVDGRSSRDNTGALGRAFEGLLPEGKQGFAELIAFMLPTVSASLAYRAQAALGNGSLSHFNAVMEKRRQLVNHPQVVIEDLLAAEQQALASRLGSKEGADTGADASTAEEYKRHYASQGTIATNIRRQGDTVMEEGGASVDLFDGVNTQRPASSEEVQELIAEYVKAVREYAAVLKDSRFNTHMSLPSKILYKTLGLITFGLTGNFAAVRFDPILAAAQTWTGGKEFLLTGVRAERAAIQRAVDETISELPSAYQEKVREIINDERNFGHALPVDEIVKAINETDTATAQKFQRLVNTYVEKEVGDVVRRSLAAEGTLRVSMTGEITEQAKLLAEARIDKVRDQIANGGTAQVSFLDEEGKVKTLSVTADTVDQVREAMVKSDRINIAYRLLTASQNGGLVFEGRAANRDHANRIGRLVLTLDNLNNDDSSDTVVYQSQVDAAVAGIAAPVAETLLTVDSLDDSPIGKVKAFGMSLTKDEVNAAATFDLSKLDELDDEALEASLASDEGFGAVVAFAKRFNPIDGSNPKAVRAIVRQTVRLANLIKARIDMDTRFEAPQWIRTDDDGATHTAKTVLLDEGRKIRVQYLDENGKKTETTFVQDGQDYVRPDRKDETLASVLTSLGYEQTYTSVMFAPVAGMVFTDPLVAAWKVGTFRRQLLASQRVVLNEVTTLLPHDAATNALMTNSTLSPFRSQAQLDALREIAQQYMKDPDHTFYSSTTTSRDANQADTGTPLLNQLTNAQARAIANEMRVLEEEATRVLSERAQQVRGYGVNANKPGYLVRLGAFADPTAIVIPWDPAVNSTPATAFVTEMVQNRFSVFRDSEGRSVMSPELRQLFRLDQIASSLYETANKEIDRLEHALESAASDAPALRERLDSLKQLRSSMLFGGLDRHGYRLMSHMVTNILLGHGHHATKHGNFIAHQAAWGVLADLWLQEKDNVTLAQSLQMLTAYVLCPSSVGGLQGLRESLLRYRELASVLYPEDAETTQWLQGMDRVFGSAAEPTMTSLQETQEPAVAPTVDTGIDPSIGESVDGGPQASKPASPTDFADEAADAMKRSKESRGWDDSVRMQADVSPQGVANVVEDLFVKFSDANEASGGNVGQSLEDFMAYFTRSLDAGGNVATVQTVKETQESQDAVEESYDPADAVDGFDAGRTDFRAQDTVVQLNIALAFDYGFVPTSEGLNFVTSDAKDVHEALKSEANAYIGATMTLSDVQLAQAILKVYDAVKRMRADAKNLVNPTEAQLQESLAYEKLKAAAQEAWEGVAGTGKTFTEIFDAVRGTIDQEAFAQMKRYQKRRAEERAESKAAAKENDSGELEPTGQDAEDVDEGRNAKDGGFDESALQQLEGMPEYNLMRFVLGALFPQAKGNQANLIKEMSLYLKQYLSQQSNGTSARAFPVEHALQSVILNTVDGTPGGFVHSPLFHKGANSPFSDGHILSDARIKATAAPLRFFFGALRGMSRDRYNTMLQVMSNIVPNRGVKFDMVRGKAWSLGDALEVSDNEGQLYSASFGTTIRTACEIASAKLTSRAEDKTSPIDWITRDLAMAALTTYGGMTREQALAHLCPGGVWLKTSELFGAPKNKKIGLSYLVETFDTANPEKQQAYAEALAAVLRKNKLYTIANAVERIMQRYDGLRNGAYPARLGKVPQAVLRMLGREVHIYADSCLDFVGALKKVSQQANQGADLSGLAAVVASEGSSLTSFESNQDRLGSPKDGRQGKQHKGRRSYVDSISTVGVLGALLNVYSGSFRAGRKTYNGSTTELNRAGLSIAQRYGLKELLGEVKEWTEDVNNQWAEGFPAGYNLRYAEWRDGEPMFSHIINSDILAVDVVDAIRAKVLNTQTEEKLKDSYVHFLMYTGDRSTLSTFCIPGTLYKALAFKVAKSNDPEGLMPQKGPNSPGWWQSEAVYAKVAKEISHAFKLDQVEPKRTQPVSAEQPAINLSYSTTTVEEDGTVSVSDPKPPKVAIFLSDSADVGSAENESLYGTVFFASPDGVGSQLNSMEPNNASTTKVHYVVYNEATGRLEMIKGNTILPSNDKYLSQTYRSMMGLANRIANGSTNVLLSDFDGTKVGPLVDKTLTVKVLKSLGEFLVPEQKSADGTVTVDEEQRKALDAIAVPQPVAGLKPGAYLRQLINAVRNQSNEVTLEQLTDYISTCIALTKESSGPSTDALNKTLGELLPGLSLLDVDNSSGEWGEGRKHTALTYDCESLQALRAASLFHESESTSHQVARNLLLDTTTTLRLNEKHEEFGTYFTAAADLIDLYSGAQADVLASDWNKAQIVRQNPDIARKLSIDPGDLNTLAEADYTLNAYIAKHTKPFVSYLKHILGTPAAQVKKRAITADIRAAGDPFFVSDSTDATDRERGHLGFMRANINDERARYGAFLADAKTITSTLKSLVEAEGATYLPEAVNTLKGVMTSIDEATLASSVLKALAAYDTVPMKEKSKDALFNALLGLFTDYNGNALTFASAGSALWGDTVNTDKSDNVLISVKGAGILNYGNAGAKFNESKHSFYVPGTIIPFPRTPSFNNGPVFTALRLSTPVTLNNKGRPGTDSIVIPCPEAEWRLGADNDGDTAMLMLPFAGRSVVYNLSEKLTKAYVDDLKTKLLKAQSFMGSVDNRASVEDVKAAIERAGLSEVLDVSNSGVVSLSSGIRKDIGAIFVASFLKVSMNRAQLTGMEDWGVGAASAAPYKMASILPNEAERPDLTDPFHMAYTMDSARMASTARGSIVSSVGDLHAAARHGFVPGDGRRFRPTEFSAYMKKLDGFSNALFDDLKERIASGLRLTPDTMDIVTGICLRKYLSTSNLGPIDQATIANMVDEALDRVLNEVDGPVPDGKANRKAYAGVFGPAMQISLHGARYAYRHIKGVKELAEKVEASRYGKALVSSLFGAWMETKDGGVVFVPTEDTTYGAPLQDVKLAEKISALLWPAWALTSSQRDLLRSDFLRGCLFLIHREAKNGEGGKLYDMCRFVGACVLGADAMSRVHKFASMVNVYKASALSDRVTTVTGWETQVNKTTGEVLVTVPSEGKEETEPFALGSVTPSQADAVMSLNKAVRSSSLGGTVDRKEVRLIREAISTTSTGDKKADRSLLRSESDIKDALSMVPAAYASELWAYENVGYERWDALSKVIKQCAVYDTTESQWLSGVETIVIAARKRLADAIDGVNAPREASAELESAYKAHRAQLRRILRFLEAIQVPSEAESDASNMYRLKLMFADANAAAAEEASRTLGQMLSGAFDGLTKDTLGTAHAFLGGSETLAVRFDEDVIDAESLRTGVDFLQWDKTTQTYKWAREKSKDLRVFAAETLDGGNHGENGMTFKELAIALIVYSAHTSRVRLTTDAAAGSLVELLPVEAKAPFLRQVSELRGFLRETAEIIAVSDGDVQRWARAGQEEDGELAWLKSNKTPPTPDALARSYLVRKLPNKLAARPRPRSGNSYEKAQATYTPYVPMLIPEGAMGASGVPAGTSGAPVFEPEAKAQILESLQKAISGRSINFFRKGQDRGANGVWSRYDETLKVRMNLSEVPRIDVGDASFPYFAGTLELTDNPVASQLGLDRISYQLAMDAPSTMDIDAVTWKPAGYFLKVQLKAPIPSELQDEITKAFGKRAAFKERNDNGVKTYWIFVSAPLDSAHHGARLRQSALDLVNVIDHWSSNARSSGQNSNPQVQPVQLELDLGGPMPSSWGKRPKKVEAPVQLELDLGGPMPSSWGKRPKTAQSTNNVEAEATAEDEDTPIEVAKFSAPPAPKVPDTPIKVGRPIVADDPEKRKRSRELLASLMKKSSGIFETALANVRAKVMNPERIYLLGAENNIAAREAESIVTDLSHGGSMFELLNGEGSIHRESMDMLIEEIKQLYKDLSPTHSDLLLDAGISEDDLRSVASVLYAGWMVRMDNPTNNDQEALEWQRNATGPEAELRGKRKSALSKANVRYAAAALLRNNSANVAAQMVRQSYEEAVGRLSNIQNQMDMNSETIDAVPLSTLPHVRTSVVARTLLTTLQDAMSAYYEADVILGTPTGTKAPEKNRNRHIVSMLNRYFNIVDASTREPRVVGLGIAEDVSASLQNRLAGEEDVGTAAESIISMLMSNVSVDVAQADGSVLRQPYLEAARGEAVPAEEMARLRNDLKTLVDVTELRSAVDAVDNFLNMAGSFVGLLRSTREGYHPEAENLRYWLGSGANAPIAKAPDGSAVEAVDKIRDAIDGGPKAPVDGKTEEQAQKEKQEADKAVVDAETRLANARAAKQKADEALAAAEAALAQAEAQASASVATDLGAAKAVGDAFMEADAAQRLANDAAEELAAAEEATANAKNAAAQAADVLVSTQTPRGPAFAPNTALYSPVEMTGLKRPVLDDISETLLELDPHTAFKHFSLPHYGGYNLRDDVLFSSGEELTARTQELSRYFGNLLGTSDDLGRIYRMEIQTNQTRFAFQNGQMEFLDRNGTRTVFHSPERNIVSTSNTKGRFTSSELGITNMYSRAMMAYVTGGSRYVYTGIGNANGGAALSLNTTDLGTSDGEGGLNRWTREEFLDHFSAEKVQARQRNVSGAERVSEFEYWLLELYSKMPDDLLNGPNGIAKRLLETIYDAANVVFTQMNEHENRNGSKFIHKGGSQDSKVRRRINDAIVQALVRADLIKQSDRSNGDRRITTVVIPLSQIEETFFASTAWAKLVEAGRTREMVSKEALREKAAPVLEELNRFRIANPRLFDGDLSELTGFGSHFWLSGHGAFSSETATKEGWEGSRARVLSAQEQASADSFAKTLNAKASKPAVLKDPKTGAYRLNANYIGPGMLNYYSRFVLNRAKGFELKSMAEYKTAEELKAATKLDPDATIGDVAAALYSKFQQDKYRREAEASDNLAANDVMYLSTAEKLPTTREAFIRAFEISEVPLSGPRPTRLGLSIDDAFLMEGSVPADMGLETMIKHLGLTIATACAYTGTLHTMVTTLSSNGMPNYILKPKAEPEQGEAFDDRMWGELAQWYAKNFKVDYKYDGTKSGRTNCREVVALIEAMRRGTMGTQYTVLTDQKGVPGSGSLLGVETIRCFLPNKPDAKGNQYLDDSHSELAYAGEAAGYMYKICAIRGFGRRGKALRVFDQINSLTKMMSVMGSIFFTIATRLESPIAASGLFNTLMGQSKAGSEALRNIPTGAISDLFNNSGLVFNKLLFGGRTGSDLGLGYENMLTMDDVLRMMDSDDPALWQLRRLCSAVGVTMSYPGEYKSLFDVYRKDQVKGLAMAAEAFGNLVGQGNPAHKEKASKAMSAFLRGLGHDGQERAFTYVMNATKMAITAQLCARLRTKAMVEGRYFDPIQELRQVGNYINEEVGGINPLAHAFDTPGVRNWLDRLMFSWQWTLGSWSAGGGTVLSNALLGGDATTGAQRAFYFGRWIRMGGWVLFGVPFFLQLLNKVFAKALNAALDDDEEPFDENVNWFMWNNEDKATMSANITPMLRLSRWLDDKLFGGVVREAKLGGHGSLAKLAASLVPLDTGDTTSGRRLVYAHFGKQGSEVINWFTKPIDQAGSKLSLPVQALYEWMTGKKPGNSGFAADYAQAGQDRLEALAPFSGKSAAGFLRMFAPFSLSGLDTFDEAGALVALGPISRGTSKYQAIQDTTKALQKYLDSVELSSGKPRFRASALAGARRALYDAALNGYDPKDILKTAKGQLKAKVYSELFESRPKTDTGMMDDEAALKALRKLRALGGKSTDAWKSAKTKYKDMNLDPRTAPGAQHLREVIREGLGTDLEFYRDPRTAYEISKQKRSAAKGGESRLFASDAVPKTVFGIPVRGVADPYFEKSPDAAGYYSLSEGLSGPMPQSVFGMAVVEGEKEGYDPRPYREQPKLPKTIFGMPVKTRNMSWADRRRATKEGSFSTNVREKLAIDDVPASVFGVPVRYEDNEYFRFDPRVAGFYELGSTAKRAMRQRKVTSVFGIPVAWVDDTDPDPDGDPTPPGGGRRVRSGTKAASVTEKDSSTLDAFLATRYANAEDDEAIDAAASAYNLNEAVDFTDHYNTELPSTEQGRQAFYKWKERNGWGNDSGYDYDYVGAFKDWLISGEGKAANGHLSDKWKKPNHPSYDPYTSEHKLMDEHGDRIDRRQWVDREGLAQYRKMYHLPENPIYIGMSSVSNVKPYHHMHDDMIHEIASYVNEELANRYGFTEDPLTPEMLKAVFMVEGGSAFDDRSYAWYHDPTSMNRHENDWDPKLKGENMAMRLEKANAGKAGYLRDNLVAMSEFLIGKAVMRPRKGDPVKRSWRDTFKRYNGGGDTEYLNKLDAYLQDTSRPDFSERFTREYIEEALEYARNVLDYGKAHGKTTYME